MAPTDFPEANIRLGEGQPQYQVLPAQVIGDPEGTMTSRWSLTEEEIDVIIRTKCIWLVQLTFNHPFQPLLLSVEKPEHVV